MQNRHVESVRRLLFRLLFTSFCAGFDLGLLSIRGFKPSANFAPSAKAASANAQEIEFADADTRRRDGGRWLARHGGSGVDVERLHYSESVKAFRSLLSFGLNRLFSLNQLSTRNLVLEDDNRLAERT
jgi:hypothetical protein